MTRRRKLRPEEEALWNKVAKTAEPLTPNKSIMDIDPAPAAKRSMPETRQEFSLPAKPIRNDKGSTAFDLTPSISKQVDDAPLRMDRKTFGRMRQGRLVPEGKIDLHGMTQDRAHPALAQFILRAHAQRKRLVLVITGKGKQDRGDDLIPVRTGVLRHQVPQWLSVPPLSQAVLQITQAHQKHGGGGAYYVYLKRNR
ncbi:MAG: Smr/MutS family protein [Paracoccaceae bacterium]